MKGWLKPRKSGTPYYVSSRINLKIHPWKYNSRWEPTRGPLPNVDHILIRNMKSAARQILALFLSFFSFLPDFFAFFFSLVEDCLEYGALLFIHSWMQLNIVNKRVQGLRALCGGGETD